MSTPAGRTGQKKELTRVWWRHSLQEEEWGKDNDNCLERKCGKGDTNPIIKYHYLSQLPPLQRTVGEGSGLPLS
ncbi:hypothetical protein E2I00_000777 [Balaenoptera physalus]|uniref:Uncharacterized protein n=1 Tax=Balaenoptera physalus TaxID=9770 RepID=A0A643C639_BALPH|nr:hypothetical protein E2I00_000777 [Balaenoptera physalus]